MVALAANVLASSTKSYSDIRSTVLAFMPPLENVQIAISTFELHPI